LADLAQGLGIWTSGVSFGSTRDFFGWLSTTTLGVAHRDSVRATAQGTFAFTDAVVPFADPLAGLYGDGSVEGLGSSEAAGHVTQYVAISAAGGQGIRVFQLGKNSTLFARKTGLLNKNDYVRIGWGWNKAKGQGYNVFRIVIGGKHFRVPLPDYLRHLDFF
jgi:hypothetical protein